MSVQQFQQVLAQARALWVTGLAGQVQAHALVAPWLPEAMASADARLQAPAHLFAAFGARLQVSHHLAFDHAQKAAHLFKQVGDITGEVQALTAQSFAASDLARSAEAVESALLATKLAESLPPGLPAVLAHNYLGVARFWSEQWDAADLAFAQALGLAQQCDPPLESIEPAVNRVAALSLRLLLRRVRAEAVSAAQQAADTADLEERLHEMVAHVAGCLPDLMRYPSADTTDCSYWFLRVAGVMAMVAAGRLDQALPMLLEAEACVAEQPNAIIDVQLIIKCLRAVYDFYAGHPEHRRSWQRLVRAAESRGHEAMLHLGLEIGVRQALDHGAPAEAAALQARLRQRERQVRQATLLSRERVVGWQLAWRAQAVQVRDLQSERQALTRQCLEDPLTGLANRRALEQRLGPWLSQQRSGALALLDLNGFKQINDRHSHRVGDQVLCQVAQLLRQGLRADDLAVRLGGDEFVLLLPDTAERAAQARCQRLAEAVREHPWGLLACGLNVSLSVGLVQAQAGEGAADLLHRADVAMYRHKAAPPDQAVAARALILARADSAAPAGR